MAQRSRTRMIPDQTEEKAINLTVADGPLVTPGFHPLADFANFGDGEAAMLVDPVIYRFLGGKPKSREDSWRRLLSADGLWNMLGYGYWAVERKSDGLRIGQVGFADFANPSTAFLKWRLDQRGLSAPTAEVFDVDGHVPGGFDVAYSLDVIEHVDDPFGFLAELESRAGIVAVNFLEPDAADDVHMHRPLPIGAPIGITAEAPASINRRAFTRSSFV